MTKSVARQMGPMISPTTMAFHGARGTSLESWGLALILIIDPPFPRADPVSSS
jgi:hypothetical protein